MEKEIEKPGKGDAESEDKAEGHKDQEWQELERLVHSLVPPSRPTRAKIVADILKTAVKLVKENHGTLNLKITSTTLKELRYSFKMFFQDRYTPKITMFGSARVAADTPLYRFAKKFASEAAKRKFQIMTGGGPGLMAAGNEGAEKGGFGLNIRLPVEQSANPFIDAEKRLIHFKYFFTRKLFLVKEAAAFAFLPGGFGTFDEAFEVLTLMQTGKSSLIPVVMLEPEGFGFWTEVVKFLDKAVLSRGFISESDRSLYRVFHSPTKALDHIEHFYSNYHSHRSVKEKLVIRIKKPIPANALVKLAKEFAFLSGGEPFVQGKPLPEENNEPELDHLTRIVFPLKNLDYGGLRRLVDFINDHTV